MTDDFGAAVSAVLRAKYPHHTAKQLAETLTRVGMGECTVKAAESILSGHLSARSLTRLTKAYGPPFLIEVGIRVTGQSMEGLIAEQAQRARNEVVRLNALKTAASVFEATSVRRAAALAELAEMDAAEIEAIPTIVAGR
jgi:hypothetical protein